MTIELSAIAREQPYKDIDFSFRLNPFSDDLSTKTDIEAIKQSILNIILTNHGEIPFDYYFGADLRKHLFENWSPILEEILRDKIENALRIYEPRIKIQDIFFEDLSDRNKVRISMVVEIVNDQRTANIEFNIERLR